MADFSAGRLERIAASAYDLVANAFLGEPSAAGFQGQKLEPVCTEPFCGGFYWHEASSWAPEASPNQPLKPMPPKNIKAAECTIDVAEEEGDSKKQCGDEEMGPVKGKDEWKNGEDPNLASTPPKVKAGNFKAMSDYLASKPLDKIDLTGAQFYPPLDKPIATRVKLIPARPDEWQWWMADNAVKVQLGVDPETLEPNFESGVKYREQIMDHLTPLLRMDKDVVIGTGRDRKTIPKDSQLQTVKPFRAGLRVAPWIGNRAQIRKDLFPLELTFGMPKQPLENYGNGKKGSKIVAVGGPPDERQLQDPMQFNVKRLDVVLRRSREDFKDFLPPLIVAKEPQMEHPEEDH